MATRTSRDIEFVRLTEIPAATIAAHMSDPRVARHLPLLTFAFDFAAAEAFIEAKESCWRRDGLGHWAILSDGEYVGWGGFQKEGDEWDFGLVLTADAFGRGIAIAKKALAIAIDDPRIPYVTFLLPPSRKNLGALSRAGAQFVGDVMYAGAAFRKYRLDTV